MAVRDLLDSMKNIFVIGRDNRYLHGRQRRPEPREPYQEQEPVYAQQGQPHYHQPYPPQGAQQQPYPPQNPSYGTYPTQDTQPFYPQQDAYAQPASNAYQRPEQPTYQTQMAPEPPREQQRNPRSRQHTEAAQQPENVVPFPGTPQAPAQEQKPVDIYVVNVFNMPSCRQAIGMLRKGHCTLVVTDQLTEKSEIRRFVDILTGACFALNGSIIRLSTKVGFYVLAPAGMTVYMDPAITGANSQMRTAQPQPYQPPIPQAPVQPAPGAYAPQTNNPYAYQPGPADNQQAQYNAPYNYGAYSSQSQAQ